MKDELTEIRGIGDAKADAIIDVVGDNQAEIKLALQKLREGKYGVAENVLVEAIE